MKNSPNKYRRNTVRSFAGRTAQSEREKGSAIIIALLVMVLLLGFVALAVTRTTNETIATSNDISESRTYEAAQASLEVMTQNFDKIFDVKLNADAADLTRIQGQLPPGFETNYSFVQAIVPTETPQVVQETGTQFQGLNALRDEWQITTAARDKSSGTEVALRRRFFNDRIPIFQFGIFYEDDLEFHPGPRFDFGGRVHSNGNLFMMANDGLYFSSKVSTSYDVFTDVARNGSPWTNWNENVFIKDASGDYIQLKHDMGSALAAPANGSPIGHKSDQPTVYKNANWNVAANLFEGNLTANPPGNVTLDLPLRIASKQTGSSTVLDYVELIKRGKNIGDLYNNDTGNVVPVTAASADSDITSTERYYNKTGIRVSLADSKARLPGCAAATGAAVTTDCGILLNGNKDGKTDLPLSGDARGYEPKPMTDYQATEVNGERFYAAGKQIWIKVEIVGVNPATNTSAAPRDITQEILSLGVTQPPIYINGKFAVSGFGTSTVDGTSACANNSSAKDCRSIIKLQRFIFGGSKVTATDTGYLTSERYNVPVNGVSTPTDYNYIVTAEKGSSDAYPLPIDNGTYGSFSGFNYNPSPNTKFFGDHTNHREQAVVKDTTKTRWVVPFPINMFDVREGLYNADIDTNATYGTKVPWNGVMSMVDIDVANLKRFLDGEFNTKFPTGTPFATAAGHTLRSTTVAATNDIPSANGWVFYVSDRRGDYDFDGEYDMEDIYGNNDGIKQAGEDVNNDGVLNADYANEAVRYTGVGASESPDIAAVFEHKFYRRGVRLINGQTLPGNYNATTPANTRGFTVASENGVYVLGNYNAYSIDSVGTPTAANEYNPQDTVDHVPASIAGDAITILSNSWSDAQSFSSPFAIITASETFDRFAMLAGDAMSSKNASPNQGGGDPRLGGGVHNFKRFLENWSNVRLNYVGSLINLFNSHNNNGSYKSSNKVYSPPVRNWVFDASFLDPNRLPPGTPFFQTLQLTGFQRLN